MRVRKSIRDEAHLQFKSSKILFVFSSQIEKILNKSWKLFFISRVFFSLPRFYIWIIHDGIKKTKIVLYIFLYVEIHWHIFGKHQKKKLLKIFSIDEFIFPKKNFVKLKIEFFLIFRLKSHENESGDSLKLNEEIVIQSRYEE